MDKFFYEYPDELIRQRNIIFAAGAHTILSGARYRKPPTNH